MSLLFISFYIGISDPKFSSYDMFNVIIMNKQHWVVYFLLMIILVTIPLTIIRYIEYGIENNATSVPVDTPNNQVAVAVYSPTKLPFKPATPVPVMEKTATPTPFIQNPPPTSWKDWSVLPITVSEELKLLYEQGIQNGNDPHAYSIFGDCQSLPEVFLGIYDHNPDFDIINNASINETVTNFQGSFDRYSPTVKDGTTEGALLYSLWNDNKEGYCNRNETPIDCELRVHKPSIVFIRVGTHYESRNEEYLIRIIENLLDKEIVPVIVTKADNREKDERINETLVRLAARYGLPVWNFWASVQPLDKHGVELGSTANITAEAYDLQIIDGIRVLDFVWHQLNQ